MQDRDFCVALVLERRLPSAYRWRAAARRDCRYMFGAVQDMRMAARMAPTPEKKEAALLVSSCPLCSPRDTCVDLEVRMI